MWMQFTDTKGNDEKKKNERIFCRTVCGRWRWKKKTRMNETYMSTIYYFANKRFTTVLYTFTFRYWPKQDSAIGIAYNLSPVIFRLGGTMRSYTHAHTLILPQNYCVKLQCAQDMHCIRVIYCGCHARIICT